MSTTPDSHKPVNTSEMWLEVETSKTCDVLCVLNCLYMAGCVRTCLSMLFFILKLQSRSNHVTELQSFDFANLTGREFNAKKCLFYSEQQQQSQSIFHLIKMFIPVLRTFMGRKKIIKSLMWVIKFQSVQLFCPCYFPIKNRFIIVSIFVQVIWPKYPLLYF